MGTIHSNHRSSDAYSLGVLRGAIRSAAPDVILTEIPPDRIEQAKRSFAEQGRVEEPRTCAFPEYTDVVFPLLREMDFRLLGAAGWRQELADNRRMVLERIASDLARADQWAEYQAAQRDYARDLAGRGDDPRFIHTDQFDRLVERAYRPFQQYFDSDLGPAGWTQINRAHTDLIHAALDTISGRNLRVLITFGTAHKYMILRSIARRDDIELLDTRALFA